MKNKSLEWVVINRNGWGDMFVDYANICLLNRKVNVIFYGYDKYIAKFLEYQDNIGEVRHIIPESREDYAFKLPIECLEKEWLQKICNLTEPKLDPRKFLMTHTERLTRTIRDIDLKVPPRNFKIDKPSLLFNPYSIQSLMYSNHCPLIPDVFVWLVDQTDWNIVLIGQKTFNHCYFGEQPFPLKINNEDEADNLQNLVGETESLIDVLHIANQCEGIITTSNALAHWSIITNKPAIVLMNDVMTNPGERKALKFYRNWIEHEPNTLLEYTCTPDQFMEAFAKKGW